MPCSPSPHALKLRRPQRHSSLLVLVSVTIHVSAITSNTSSLKIIYCARHCARTKSLEPRKEILRPRTPMGTTGFHSHFPSARQITIPHNLDPWPPII